MEASPLLCSLYLSIDIKLYRNTVLPSLDLLPWTLFLTLPPLTPNAWRKCLHWFFLCAVVSLKTETQHKRDIISRRAGVMNEEVLRWYKYSLDLWDYFFFSLRGIQQDFKRQGSTMLFLKLFLLLLFFSAHTLNVDAELLLALCKIWKYCLILA